MKTSLLNRICTIVFVLSANFMFAQDIWTPSMTDGFGDQNNLNIRAMLVFKGNLYAGAGDDTAALYSTSTGNPGSWQRKYSSSSDYGVQSLTSTTEGGGYMYASMGIPNNVYRTFDGTTWNRFYTGSNIVRFMVPFKGLGTVDSIYTVEASISGDMIRRAPYNNNDPDDTAGTWQTVVDFTSISPGTSVTCLAVYNGRLYVGTNYSTVWSTADGTNWSQDTAIGTGFGSSGASNITAMGIYSGYFYIAVYNTTTGAEIWRSNDDVTWNMTAQFPPYREVSSFAVNGTDLWASLDNDGTGVGEVVKSPDGLVFSLSENNGFGDAGNNGYFASLVPFGNNMYYCTQNYTFSGPLITTAPTKTNVTRGGPSYTSTGGQIWRTCLGTPPVIDLGSDRLICSNQSVILDAGPGAAYSWSTGDTTEAVNVLGSLTGTQYVVLVTDASGCTGSDTVKVTSNNVPTINVVTPYTQHAALCLGDSTSLSNQVYSNYRIPLTPLVKTVNDSILDNQSTYDTLAVTGVNDLAAAAIVSLTIDSLYHTYDGDIELGVYAPDGSYTLLSNRNGNGSANYTGTVFAASSIGDITTASAPFTGTFAPQGGFNSFSGPADGNWILAVTDYANGDQGVIKGWTLKLSVADTILTLVWTPTTGLTSSTLATTEVIPPSGSTIYTLTATNNAGCSSQINDTIVVPSIHITASSDSICAGSTSNLIVTGAVNPTWSPAATLSSTSGFSVTASPVATTVYSVSDSVSGCYAQDSITITMDQLLTVSASANQTICHGDSATIAATISGGTAPFTYAWTGGGSSASENVSPAGTTNYMVIASDAFGCGGSATTTVTVNASTDIYGHVSYSGGNVTSSNVVIYKYEPFLVHFDTVQVSTTDAGGNYHFTAIDHFTYLIEVFPAAADTMLVPTYYGNSFLWDAATIVTHDCVMADTFNISATEEVSFGTGPGYLHGQIVQGPGYDSHPGYPTIGGGHERVPGEPIPGIDVKLGRNPGGQMVTSTSTDSNEPNAQICYLYCDPK